MIYKLHMRQAIATFTKSLTRKMCHRPLFLPYRYSFSEKLTPESIPKQHLQIQPYEQTVGEEDVKVYQTKGAVSIMDSVPGVKDAETGELYVLSFTCTKCNTKSIRSFTKHAYHKGVVLVRCGGCQNIHLISDNLGWFHDQATNLDTMYKEGVVKVKDQIAIVSFLKKAFEKDVGEGAIAVDESGDENKINGEGIKINRDEVKIKGGDSSSTIGTPQKD